jgi:phosphatidate cytidylyltransferase
MTSTPTMTELAHNASFQQSTRLLFFAVIGVLLFASAVGALLKWRVARGEPHGVIDNLNSRIKAWWVMVLLVSLSFVFGKAGVILLFMFMSFAAMREYVTLAYTRSADHMGLALMFYLALPLQYGLIWIDWYGLYSIFIPVHVFLVLPILASLSGDTNRFLERTAKMQWGLMICVYCLSLLPALLTLDIPGYEGRHLLLIAYLIVVVQASDVLQYVWGKLFGRRKIAPALSPSKTLEGLVGGVASATLLGTALYWITPFNPWQSALVSLAICLMGFLGGLVMSAIKRDRGVKDWGTMIEGHGGMLDRLDSVVFAAPVFFHVVRYWWVP